MLKRLFISGVIIAGLVSQIRAEEEAQSRFIVIFPVTLVSPGLADDLVKMYEEEYKIPIKMISLCTGDASKLIAAGSERIDAVIGHDPEAEEKLVGDGYTLNRRPVCYSDYYLVGPSEDPAGVKGSASVTEALKKIRDKKALFFSRGDDSGTHKLELKMWQKAGIRPEGSWYIVTNMGTDATLEVASRKRGYFISHSASYLDMKETISLDILLKSPDLATPYHIMALNPQKYPNADYLNALKFIDWITSPKIQKYIAGYGVEKYSGQTFFPLIEEVSTPGARKASASGVNINGYLQVQYCADESANDTFAVKRARIIGSSKLNEKYDWKIMFDGISTPALLDAFINYAVSPAVRVTFGQYKVPFSYEYLTSSSKLDTIETSQAVTQLSPQYDMGISAEAIVSKFRFAAGVFNGEGKNKTDVNENKDVAGRISYAPDKYLEIGSAYYGGLPEPDESSKYCSDIYLAYSKEELGIKFEYLFSNRNATEKQGYYAQAKYGLSQLLEILARYDNFDSDINSVSDKDTNNALLGLNYFANSNVKIQANYTVKSEKPEIENNTFSVQSQVVF